MAAARTVALSEIITQVLYELRDPNGYNYNKDGAYAELIGYINKCNEYIYELLVDDESELIQTGSGTFATVAGTQSYDLSANTMGDFWVPRSLGGHGDRQAYAVWISTKEPMYMCREEDTFDAINQEEDSATGSRTEPREFCIIGNYLWFRDVPDDAYTVKLRYFPNFVPLTLTTENMPFKNLFNNEVIQGTILYAKHRNERGIQTDAIIKDIFTMRAARLSRKRMSRQARITPRM